MKVKLKKKKQTQNMSRNQIVSVLCYSVGLSTFKPAKIQKERTQTPLLKERRLEDFRSH